MGERNIPMIEKKAGMSGSIPGLGIESCFKLSEKSVSLVKEHGNENW